MFDFVFRDQTLSIPEIQGAGGKPMSELVQQILVSDVLKRPSAEELLSKLSELSILLPKLPASLSLLPISPCGESSQQGLAPSDSQGGSTCFHLSEVVAADPSSEAIMATEPCYDKDSPSISSDATLPTKRQGQSEARYVVTTGSSDGTQSQQSAGTDICTEMGPPSGRKKKFMGQKLFRFFTKK
jgi:hypothetical protein